MKSPHDKYHGIGLLGFFLVVFSLLAMGCASTPKDVCSTTITFYGLDVKAWDETTQSPQFRVGVARTELITIGTNVVSTAEISKQTSYESQGWFKGNRVQTSFSIGKTAVTQPSQSQQMPSMAGSNAVWQPAVLPK